LLVADIRQPLFIVTTPYDAAPQVVVYHDTMTIHIPMARQIADLHQYTTTTLSSPSVVVSGTSNPGYVAFVNQNILSSGSQAPFVVFVDPEGNPLPAVASVGFRRDFKDLTRHMVLWSPLEKK